MSYADRFTDVIRKHFVVVHWDQRESGQTVLLNKSPIPLTVSVFVSDAIELINFLRARFSTDKIYLMGHSWGGYLGLRVAAARPDLLNAYFAISPMVHQLESERLSLQTMKDKAISENNKEAMAELNHVEVPFITGDQLFYHRKWLSKLMHTTMPSRERVMEWATIWLSLFNEASKTNFFEFAPELPCPVYFFIGSNDFQTHHSLAESYYQQVVCEEKKLFRFIDSAHNPHLTESKKFQETVIDQLNQN
jgi:pimeloyl-ACP methyl ester carboxylesterase